MSRVYTVVATPGGEYACHGRVSREDAIKEVRACYQHRLERCQQFLAKSDDEIHVEVVRGLYRRKSLEVLPALTTTPESN